MQEIVKIVDEDGSGEIEFGEFLSIIKGGNNAVSNNHVKQFNMRCRKGAMMEVAQQPFISSSKSSQADS